MSDLGKNTRSIRGKRETLLREWIAELKDSSKWREFIWKDGGLKLIEVRAEMGVRDPECKNERWGEDYFTPDHWSYKYRTEIEGWVRERLSLEADRDMFGQLLKGASDLPPWLQNENLSPRVMELILEYCDGRIKAETKTAKLQREINRLEQQILRLETQQKHLMNSSGHNTVEEHYMNSVRTLRYNAGIDIDLSQQGLLGEE